MPADSNQLGRKDSISSETVFYFHYYHFNKAAVLLTAYFGKRKKETTLLGINTMLPLNCWFWYNSAIFSPWNLVINITLILLM